MTEAMSRAADQLQREAGDAERRVRARLVGAAVAALLAMTGFTLLLRGRPPSPISPTADDGSLSIEIAASPSE